MTKASTLYKLKEVLKKSKIAKMSIFRVKDWIADESNILCKIRQELKCEKVLVRSSALQEDSTDGSLAGCFYSALDVSLKDDSAMIEAVEKVVDSYKQNSTVFSSFEVLVQPMLEGVSISGVVFTRDVNTHAPYYIINYDDTTGKTDTVTSGNSKVLKTQIIFRNLIEPDNKFSALLVSIREVEQCLGSDALDIEFAIDKSGVIYILQARPIVGVKNSLPHANEIEYYLNKIYKKVVKLNSDHPYLYGDNTMFGIMPDWNPAEIIGVRPRPLALSLYKYLVTDRTWAYQRDNYGYKNLRSFPLLVSFVGYPYIDVRISFNSFIPKSIDDGLSSKLVNYYLKCLKENKKSHDKIEFDIILSCFSLDIDSKLDKLKQDGFSKQEIESLYEALLELTNKIIGPGDTVFTIDLSKIEELKNRQKNVLSSSLTDLEKIYWLLEDCCRYGTLPFAGLARAGFIAIQMLRSFVNRGWIDSKDLESYMTSLNTVARQMNNDHIVMNNNQFLNKYGHLRPGTYDILSKRYDEAYDLYFRDKLSKEIKKDEPFRFSQQVLDKIELELNRVGFTFNASELFDFIKKAIEAREYSKFVFSKSVSEILSLVKAISTKYGLNEDEGSFLNIQTFTQLYSVLDHRDLADILKEEAVRNKKFFEAAYCIKLPALITEANDIYSFELFEGEPNFITIARTQAEVIGEDKLMNEDLSGKIVMIENADPGYDWIFTKKIAGLITMYGGTNSHMAIRAAEMNIPSVIGAGEKKYSSWRKASNLEIDCENKQVRVLK